VRQGKLWAWMRKDAVLRWATAALGAAFLALAVALVVLEPLTGLFAVAGAAVGLALRFFSERTAPGPEPAARALTVGRLVLIAVTVAATVLTSVFLLANTAEEPGRPDPPSLLAVLRAPYVAELSYVDPGRWQGAETFTLDRGILRRRARSVRPREVLPSPWRLLRIERVAGDRLMVFGRDTEPVVFDVPAWQPLTASHTIPPPAVTSRPLRAVLVAAEGSRVVLRAPERRVWRTTPGSEATPDARDDWERREIPLRVGGVAAAGEDMVVEVRSDLARQELFPEGLVGATAWGGLKWLFGILGLGAVLSSKVREFLWGWVKRLRRPRPRD
jgi:hypothetical protein